MEVMPGTLDTLILRGLSLLVRATVTPSRGGSNRARATRSPCSTARCIPRSIAWRSASSSRRGEWGVSPTARRAKFYRLTPLGRARLKEDAKGWTDYVAAVARVMSTRAQPA